MTVPTDPLYDEQWHFPLIGDIETVWNDYDGTGVTVVVYDEGIEYDHTDLAANYDASMHFTFDGITYDPMPIDGESGHGTSCAGLIGAVANNGIGGTGVAYGVTLTGVNYLDDLLFAEAAVYDAALLWAANFDIMSNSWGSSPFYSPLQNLNNPDSEAAHDAALYEDVAAIGRDGLGTIIVQAAGNEARNVNGDGLNVSRHTITVAATDDQGDAVYYTNYGSGILVTAPASGVTTDLTADDGYNQAGARDGDPFDPDYTSTFNGTSAATPTVAGVIALMLEANPDLGWRDVNDILALSASHTGSDLDRPGTGEEVGDWELMGDGTWNGGGTMFHQSYGYGMVDAYAAVRMSEAWLRMNGAAETSANELSVLASYNGGFVAIPDGSGNARVRIVSTEDIEIDTIYVSLGITHANATNLEIFLIAPDGTRIELFAEDGNKRLMDDGLVWTFGVEGLRGYSSEGTWTVAVRDIVSGETGKINDAEITFFGGEASADEIYTFTDDFKALVGVESTRSVIDDTNGGVDWLNFVAMTGNMYVAMAAGGVVRNNNQTIAHLGAGTADFENFYAGDGNDTVLGNTLANEILGGRGNDSLRGGKGNDLLEGGDHKDKLYGGNQNDTLLGGTGNDYLSGGRGNDLSTGNVGRDTFVFRGNMGTDRVTDFADNVDTLRFDNALWGNTNKSVSQIIASFADVVGSDTVFDFGGGNKVTVAGVTNVNVFLNDITII